MKGKVFKKIAIICMSVCLMAPVSTVGVMAESGAVTTSIGTCTVSIPKGYLPLRESPDKDSAELAKLKNGAKLSILNKDNSDYWYVHSVEENVSGYVRSKYVKEGTASSGSSTTSGYGTGTAIPYNSFSSSGSSSSSSASSGTRSSSTSGATYSVRVATGYLALRTAPSYDYRNEIGELYTGDTVTVQDTSNGQYWWVYSPKLGKSGYVNKDYLVGSGSSSSSSSSGATYSVRVATGYLALRTAPSYNSANEIGELYTGDTVTVQDTSNGQYWWVYSPKLGKSGYVNKDYLVGSGSSSSSSKTTYTVRVATGYLALRTAPSYNEANEIGELYTGDTVTVQDKSNSQYWWVYSSKYGRSGYVNKDYLY